MPGRCAAPPAPAMMHARPRSRALLGVLEHRVGRAVRRDHAAPRTATPKSFSTRAACCITSQSLCDPITTPTSGFSSMALASQLARRAGVVELAAVRVEDALQRVVHVDLRRPAEVLHRVVDLRHAVLHVLVALAVVLAGGRLDQLHLARRCRGTRDRSCASVEHHLRELAHREVVRRVADVVDLARSRRRPLFSMIFISASMPSSM